jgi:hypothetical protein
MSGQTAPALWDELTLFAEASPAKTSPSLASVPDFPATEAVCSGTHSLSQRTSKLNGFSWKMCPAFSHQIKDAISQSSSMHWPTQGLVTSNGASWIRNSSESPNVAAASSLSQVLETPAAGQYSLSVKAAAGILLRAERRGRRLPELLRTALTEIVSCSQDQQ